MTTVALGWGRRTPYFPYLERSCEVVSGGGEGAHNLPIGRCAGGDVEVVDVDFNLAVDAAGNGGNDLSMAQKTPIFAQVVAA